MTAGESTVTLWERSHAGGPDISGRRAAYYQDQALVMAGTLMATLPLIVVVVIFGRQLISGIMDGAVKA